MRANTSQRPLRARRPWALRPRPLLYGLLLFARTLGTDPERLVPTQIAASPLLHLKAWAVRDRGNRLHVLLIDKGTRAVTVTLRIPAGAPAPPCSGCSLRPPRRDPG